MGLIADFVHTFVVHRVGVRKKGMEEVVVVGGGGGTSVLVPGLQKMEE